MTAPNVVVLLTDDQPRGLLEAMPVVKKRIKAPGLTLQYGMAPSPLCSMTRSTLITGREAGHDLGVWNNQTPGGWEALDPYEGETIATALKEKNYHTGLFGKYVNGWSRYSAVVPPGWDEFAAISPDNGGDGAYFNYSLQGTAAPTHYAEEPEDYSTDVVRDRALDFINNAPDEQPLFLYFSPYGVHGRFRPAPRHIGLWTDPIHLNPSYNSTNTGKASWINDLPLVDEDQIREIIKDQHETIMSIDEAIDQIMDAMKANGRTDTLYVFAGDNGLQRGQHKLMGKYVPYQASTHLQMLMRWDGQIVPGLSDRITTPADLVATILQATGAVLPKATGSPIGTDKKGTFLEGAVMADERPAYIGWRTRDFMYVQWSGGFEELYDYAYDPYELSNVATLKARKRDELRVKAEEACQPRPLGWI